MTFTEKTNHTRSILIILILTFSTGFHLIAQVSKTTWDNTVDKNWPSEFRIVKIPSSVDTVAQLAIFYQTTFKQPQPLIVSLHTWSGNYLQEDPLSKEILLRGWNYIHPDFRGANNRPEACGSSLVISDISDAIKYAVANGNVDTSEIHLIGVSGGGYATLLAFMLLDYPVKSFSAWAPISDLEDWYWETKGRGLQYASHLEVVTTGTNGIFNKEEAAKRSPIRQKWNPIRDGSSLHLYTGIHDGYAGSVPITHSMRMYDKLIKERYPNEQNALIGDSLIYSIAIKRNNPNNSVKKVIGKREVHLHRSYGNISIDIFEGGHEMVVPQALSLLPVNNDNDTLSLNIVTIGDSNGAFSYGWPTQLGKLLPHATIINHSIAGNTIGFDNLGNSSLNTLQNINRYLEQSIESVGMKEDIDLVIIGLGTNDAKKIFSSKHKQVSSNLERLIETIKIFFSGKGLITPQICILTPPPIDESKADKEKYGGANKLIQKQISEFRNISKKHNVFFINSNTILTDGFDSKTTDGIHLTESAQFDLATVIQAFISKQIKFAE